MEKLHDFAPCCRRCGEGEIFLAAVQEDFFEGAVPVFFGNLLGGGAPVKVPETGFGRGATIGDFEIVNVSGIHGRAANRTFHSGCGY